LRHHARGVHTARLDAQAADVDAFEYYVEGIPASGPAVRFPSAPPPLNQTVVVAQR